MNQYYCENQLKKDQLVRVHPYGVLDRELGTLAPDLHILLASQNSKNEAKIAYCFVCHDFVGADPVSYIDRKKFYLARKHVGYRQSRRKRKVA